VTDRPTTVDAYLAGFSGEVRARLDQVRATIRAAAPAATERIAYGMPTYRGRKNLVHFAGFAHHVGLYPTPAAIEAFASELAGYVTSKGAIQLPHDRPLPLDLVSRITAFRVRADAEG
jgi:uncharacterized protein YdhG (YjbR/CyaY superfamily)